MKDHIIKPNMHKEYPLITKAEGIYMWDENGKRYIDASSGPMICNVGQNVPEIVEAITKQLHEVNYAHRYTYATKPAIELSEAIVNMAPEGLNWVSFCSGGTEATEGAVKMAREYWLAKGKPSKYLCIGRWHSYHGNTLGATSMGGMPYRRNKYAPLLLPYPHAAAPHCYRCPFGRCPESCNLECAKDIEETIQHYGKDNISCVIVEPIVGSSIGSPVPKDGYMQELREICTRNEVLLICDEVITGFGRTGKNFAVDHWDMKPDIITVAKGLAAGYVPLGAIIAQDFIKETFENGPGGWGHGYTYSNNPAACAAGLAVLKYVQANNLVENARVVGEYLGEKLKALQAKYDVIGDVRGLGMLWGVEFVKDRETKESYSMAEYGLTFKLLHTALEMGLSLYEADGCNDGYNGDCIVVSPALNTTKEQVDEIVDLFDKTIEKVFSQLK